MKFQYKLSKEDYLTHQLYLATHERSIMYKRETIKWLFSLVYIGLGVVFFIKGLEVWQGLLFVLLGIVWYVFFPRLYNKRYKKSYAQFIDDNFSEVLEKELSVSIDKQFVKTNNGESETSVKLSEVDSVIELKDLFFLSLKSGMTLMIPKREVEDIQVFLAYCTNLGIRHKNHVGWEWKA